jgi:hypothetical protein
VRAQEREGTVPVPEVPETFPAATTDEPTTGELVAVARTRVFFGHQSVGTDLLAGVDKIFRTRGVPAPPVQRNRLAPDTPAGAIVHSFLGRNDDPRSKVEDFAARLRAGVAEEVEIAMMKFCYIDIRADSDVDTVFTSYRDTMTALERDYPQVRFVACTVPLMTEPLLTTRIKSALTGSTRFGPAENAARERLNTLIREFYPDRHLFDIAAVESTGPDGTRVSGDTNGERYFALHRDYARDNGHPNTEGSRRMAAVWLKLVARLSAT